MYLQGAVGDPTRFGDCPFCMRVCMALTLKGVKFEMVYIDLSNKPQWFVELSKRGGGKGTTPVLVDGDKVSCSVVVVVVDKCQLCVLGSC